MTGKEDLFEKSTSCVDIENDVWDILNFEIMKSLKEENEELKNKLTKYKRAFDILKGTLTLSNRDEEYYLIGDFYDKITKEEYELLEELMSDAKD